MQARFQEFVAAQAPVWQHVLKELRNGQKTSHWIWWVFPQLAVLGRSQRARHFGLDTVEGAAAYLAHPTLGPRLIETSRLLLDHADKDPESILGPVDALKVQSSMTLFEAAPGADPVFSEVLERLYGGERCAVTAEVIRRSGTKKDGAETPPFSHT